ncbi:MAG: hypothetical protein IH946_05390 [Bacteroidetes bacterium]|nr:hypothetical protein [Bacteroidota bacterium]
MTIDYSGQITMIVRDTLIKLLVLIPLSLTIGTTTAQYKSWEAGVLFGASNYLGDIGQGLKATPFIGNLQWKHTKPGFNFLLRYHPTNNLSIRGNLILGFLKADDRLSLSYDRRYIRNASFRTNLYEVSLQGEYNILRRKIAIKPKDQGFKKGIRASSKAARKCPTPGSGNIQHEMIFYIFGGIGGFHFDPESQYKGEWYKLQPLGTEGQGLPEYGTELYSLYQVSIPMGIGFYYYAPNLRYKIGYEIGWRKTFTDYIDDVGGEFADPEIIREARGNIAAAFANRTAEVSNNPDLDLLYSRPGNLRGQSKNDDSYFVMGITFTFVLSKYKIQIPKYRHDKFQLFGF